MSEPAAAAPATKPRKNMTIPMLNAKKKNKEPIVQLAVYDYENAITAEIGRASCRKRVYSSV